MATSNRTSRKFHSRRLIQSFYLVWLDENLNENDETCRNLIMKVKQVIDTVDICANIDECIDFITDQSDEVALMITSKTYAQQLLPIAKDLSQINSIYIFSPNDTSKTTWTHQCPKMNDSFTNIESICEVLEQSLKDNDHNNVSISFAKTAHETSDIKKDTLDCSFMYTQILKEILLTINFNDTHFNDFLTFCRAELAENPRELRNIDRLQNEYRNREPIRWYTCQSFLYSMVNKALRLMDIDIIIKIGFFVCDLHTHIAVLHTEQFNTNISSDSFTVYRGQSLSLEDFDQMKRNKGGLLAFNNFLSTSKKREISLRFIHRVVARSDLVPVIFVMCIGSSINRTPFANVADVSAMKREEEILFSMHSVFRIGQMKKVDEDNRIWEVELILTSENDPDLHTLTERMREEIQGSTGWHRLAQLLLRLGKFNKAEELYVLLLRESNDQIEKARLFHQLGMIYSGQGKYEAAIKYYRKSLEITRKSLPSDHPLLANSYNSIGCVYDGMGDYSKALEYYQRSLEIRKKSLPVDHSSLARSYNNIGLAYDNMGEYSKALDYYQRSLEIWKKSLPGDHPSLATSYNNIGMVHKEMGEYPQALEYFEKSLEIRRKSLPSDHPLLAICYNNIGSVYDNMDDYSTALEYYVRSLEIMKKSLSADHPDMAASYNNIGLVYDNMGEYSKALEYLERALGILQRSVPSNHPNMKAASESIEVVKKKL